MKFFQNVCQLLATISFIYLSFGFSNQIYAQNEIYSIPTVVHIIHTDSSYTNISDNQVYSAINALNDDFRRNAGTQGAGMGVDTEIEFCLAERTPWGTVTNGINRIHCVDDCAMNYDSIGLDISINENAVKSLSQWNEEDYFNI